jgi:hypothetical protein
LPGVCHFITGALPPDADVERIRAVSAEAGLGFALTPVAHKAARAQLPGWSYVRLTGAMCDCGTPLGDRPRPDEAHDLERETKALRTKGWSAAKVKRWREQREAAGARNARVRQTNDAHWLSSALAQWDAALRAVLERGATSELGLFLHWYRLKLTTEPIDLLRRRRVALESLGADVLRGIEEDVLYIFHRGPA